MTLQFWCLDMKHYHISLLYTLFPEVFIFPGCLYQSASSFDSIISSIQEQTSKFIKRCINFNKNICSDEILKKSYFGIYTIEWLADIPFHWHLTLFLLYSKLFTLGLYHFWIEDLQELDRLSRLARRRLSQD